MKYEDIKNWKWYEPIIDKIILDAIEYEKQSSGFGHLSCARAQKISNKNLPYIATLIEKLKELKYIDEMQHTIITKEEFEHIINARKQQT